MREVVPVLEEIGDDQEQAAATLGAGPWQMFWRITPPSIRWAVTYGVILATARALGEFGAVAVASGHISGFHRDDAALRPQALDRSNNSAAHAAAVVLALFPPPSVSAGDEPHPARDSKLVALVVLGDTAVVAPTDITDDTAPQGCR